MHPEAVASTRLRVMQYTTSLQHSGVTLQLWSFFRSEDLPAWFGTSHRARLFVLLRALLRLPRIVTVVRGAGLVIVQREALPLGPPVVELLAARGRRLVWDVDDAVWEDFTSPTAGRVPRWLRATGGKYERLCARADEVWAGSAVLAIWCRRLTDNVLVVPTVVDVPLDRPKPASDRTVGWIGSHSTAAFVAAVLPAMARVDPRIRVVLVGGRPEVPLELNADVRAWSPEAEDAALRETRVGLYPVDHHHPLAEGKCGFKAVLYMSRGIPPVVTPTSTNAAVVRDGVDGFYAASDKEWTAHVQALLDDGDLWERLSRSAHQRALEHYSLQVWAPRVVARIRALATGA